MPRAILAVTCLEIHVSCIFTFFFLFFFVFNLLLYMIDLTM